MLSDKDFAELRAEWNDALVKTDGFAAKGLDRTDLMKSVRQVSKGPITVGEIISAVSAETSVSAVEITGARSTARVVRPRRLAMYLSSELIPALTHNQIAGHFKREQSTVPLAMAAARKLLEKDPGFARHYQHTRWRLGLAA